MKKTYLKSSIGFTMAEVIVVSVLTVVILTAAYHAYKIAMDAWVDVYIKGNLQRDGMYAIERMIRGVDASFKGIQEAQGIVAPGTGASASQIEFIDQSDPNPLTPTITRAFGISGSKLVYIDESNNNTDLISQNVQSVTFNRPAGLNNLVEITLTLQRAAFMGTTVSVTLDASVRLRNM